MKWASPKRYASSTSTIFKMRNKPRKTCEQPTVRDLQPNAELFVVYAAASQEPIAGHRNGACIVKGALSEICRIN